MLVQNPANTVTWLLAALQMLAAPTSLLIDTVAFQQALLKGITPKLQAFWVVLVVLGIVFGPVHTANILHLYVLPKWFRMKLLAFAAIVAVLLAATSLLTRHCLTQRQKRRVVSV